MPSPDPRWQLAFPCQTVTFDGSTLGLRPEADVRADLAKIREAGVEWVMTAGLHLEEKADFDLVAAARRLNGLVDEAGLKMASHHGIMATFDDLGADQDFVRDRAKRLVDIWAPMAPTAIVLHPGRMWGHHATSIHTNEVYVAQAKAHGAAAVAEAVAGNLRYLGELAEQAGLKIALENLGRFGPLAAPDSLPALVAAIDHPAVGYCIDSGHAHAFGESVPWWLQVAGDKLYATHFHDNHGRGPAQLPPTGLVESTKQVDEHLPVGFGTIPWQEVMQSLAKIDYRGPVGCETWGWPVDDPVESLSQAQAWWSAAERLALKGLN